MIRGKATVYAVALLIIGFGVFLGGNLSLADETDRPRTGQTTCHDDAGKVIDCPSNPSNSESNSDTPTPSCSGCNVFPTVHICDVEITNTTFFSGTNCVCTGEESIRIGPGVTIKSGATVTFSAPTVILQSRFNAEPGSVVSIETDEVPPAPWPTPCK